MTTRLLALCCQPEPRDVTYEVDHVLVLDGASNRAAPCRVPLSVVTTATATPSGVVDIRSPAGRDRTSHRRPSLPSG